VSIRTLLSEYLSVAKRFVYASVYEHVPSIECVFFFAAKCVYQDRMDVFDMHFRHIVTHVCQSLPIAIIQFYCDIAFVFHHDVVYHVINGKRKCDMDVWHFEDDCAKCKKTKK
jgi:hypothetical protein